MNWTKKIINLFVVTAFMLLSTSLFAQDKTQTADDFSTKFSTKLQTQLNLSQDQTAQVQQVLSEYNNSKNATITGEVADEATGEMIDTPQEVNDAVSELLDETQKATWENVKVNFWAEVDAGSDDTQKM